MIGVKLAAEDAQRLAELAKRRGVTVSAAVRGLVLDLLEREATGPPGRSAAA